MIRDPADESNGWPKLIDSTPQTEERLTMASLRKRGENWYYRYVDANGVKVERKGCPDKQATKGQARAAETEAADIRSGAIDAGTLRLAKHAREPAIPGVANTTQPIFSILTSIPPFVPSTEGRVALRGLFRRPIA
ncbi:MAG: hypothetical protein ACLQGP_36755, partial [Isosphaeraceae bacterium]